MKLFRFVLPAVLAAVSFSASAVFGACGCVNSIKDDLDENDFDAVVEFIQSKRTIQLQEKACNLAISGDVRVEYANINEKINGYKLRGGHARDCSGNLPILDPTTGENIGGTNTGDRITRCDFDVEFNLNFDYKCDRTWAVASLQFDNSMGVQESGKVVEGDQLIQQNPLTGFNCQPFNNHGPFGSGSCSDICLRKAYIGYNICTDGCTRLDVECGRRRFYDVFDSRVEFNCQFDGLLFRYGTQMDCCSDAYLSLAGFVIDERGNHFGWAVEAGLLNICDTGLDFKYSFIDWQKKGTNRAFIGHPEAWQFQVSQFLGYYHFDPEILCMPSKLYGAFLYNSAAKGQQFTNNQRQNFGWYVGATFGEVSREGDWSVDINYQYVQAQCVPDPDVSGIGRGNVLKQQLTQLLDGGTTQPGGIAANSRGNANYKGWKIEGLYAVTDDLSLDASFQMAVATNKAIGGKLNYNRFKLAAIYAF